MEELTRDELLEEIARLLARVNELEAAAHEWEQDKALLDRLADKRFG